MRNPILKICSIYAIVSVIVLSCKTSVEEPKEIQKEQVNETPQIKTDAATPTGGGVMMQGFYWDVPAGGTWWDVIKAKVPAWGASGITAVWLPPVSKAQNGPFSMGYDPFDYYDLGEYNQMGSVETRFGSKTELVSFINQAHTNGLQVYADIVLNHNSGGSLEANPFTGTNTYTKFNPASGKFIRSYFDFHANDLHSFDDGYFGGFPDLCHDKTYVKDWLYNRTDAVAKYYKNVIGFDGWRFDYVKGFNPNVVKDWVTATGGFSVGENWDGNAATLKSWVDATGRTSSAFDFACYYKMDEAFDNNDLTKLNGDMLWKRDATKAVTFVSNHDTDVIWNKMLAYAYILTHEGYPCVFYRDYEEWLNKERLNNLIWIHNNLASGTTTIKYADNDEYIAVRNGNPGLMVYINNSDFWQERWVQTNWASTQIKDYTGHSSWVPTTQVDSWVKIQAPPKSYSVWSKTSY